MAKNGVGWSKSPTDYHGLITNGANTAAPAASGGPGINLVLIHAG